MWKQEKISVTRAYVTVKQCICSFMCGVWREDGHLNIPQKKEVVVCDVMRTLYKMRTLCDENIV